MEPTGNARAYTFSDEPLVRMRNTAIRPGTGKLEDMIGSIDHGYYLKRSTNGQADSTSEFMFGVTQGYEIRNGILGGAIRDPDESRRCEHQITIEIPPPRGPESLSGKSEVIGATQLTCSASTQRLLSPYAGAVTIPRLSSTILSVVRCARPIRAYSLFRNRNNRHTAASQAVMSGENLPLVGKLLGHRRHRTTAGYAHLADAHLVEATEKVGTIIVNAMRYQAELPPRWARNHKDPMWESIVQY